MIKWYPNLLKLYSNITPNISMNGVDKMTWVATGALQGEKECYEISNGMDKMGALSL